MSFIQNIRTSAKIAGYRFRSQNFTTDGGKEIIMPKLKLFK